MNTKTSGKSFVVLRTVSSELKSRSIWKTHKILALSFWAFFVGPFLYKPIYKSFLLGQGKIYSYSEQAESINKDCCNSQTSPGGHSQNRLSAKDFLFLCLYLLLFVLYLYLLHLYFCICVHVLFISFCFVFAFPLDPSTGGVESTS